MHLLLNYQLIIYIIYIHIDLIKRTSRKILIMNLKKLVVPVVKKRVMIIDVYCH